MRTDHPLRSLPWLTAFFIAMAFLESAVVVYLRALYYPDGFRFPLVPLDTRLMVTEMGRELATLVMLLAPAAIASRSALERFAWFSIGFGIWDIFYYVWLWVLLGWPSSLADPDLLFLLPVPWVGPVWAPCLISAGLITLGLVILHARSKDEAYRIGGQAWFLLVGGALLMVVSFTLGPALLLTDAPVGGVENGLLPLTADDFRIAWYMAGWALAIAGLLLARSKGAASGRRHT
ncbi:MAG TPA: hypothetical protein PKD45_12735 [Flavobacteriales bacterium]|nr:hypothetical protein [Flavobacteriales bacterium]